ncbi:MAG TPA: hypothetical protein VGC76_10150 [Pyrinomonadaceae bacterium]|jgi:hypothetical protein
MKKIVFRPVALVATFFLGCLFVFALYYFVPIPYVPQPELLPATERFDCVDSKSFPGISKQISELKKGKSGYFPKDKFSGKWEKADSFMNDWYGNHLKAMGEKSLLNVSDKNAEIYRFLWLRSFHHPIFVRIERNRTEIKLFTKELDGAGGYEPGKVFRSNEVKLKQEEFCDFLKLLEKADYWRLPTKNDDYSGEDGAQWILEGVKENRYHVVDRWTPEKGDYRAACIYLLKLSGVDTDRLKDDLY